MAEGFLFGKAIKLFLVKGHTNDLITAEVSNWTGKAFKIPRINISKYANSIDLQKPSVYILLGKNEDGHDAAYIGEAEIGIDRVIQQARAKDFWNEVVIFNSKDLYLNKATIKYLENKMYEHASLAGRYVVLNTNVPNKPVISESDRAEFDEFFFYIKLLTTTLGHKLFEEVKETIKQEGQDGVRFICKNSTGAYAIGTASTEGFVVFKDSIFNGTNQVSMNIGYQNQKDRMIKEGILLLTDSNNYKLTKDYTFSSPTAAAQMVQGRSSSGQVEWKSEKGVSLKEHQEYFYK